MKVNTFIVGAPKAGTTSLHFYLDQHPDVTMSSVKEPDYFSCKEVKELYYRSKVIDTTKGYNSLFEKESKVMGESSVSYLFYENVPKRIFEYNPNAKIIIMLRNPVERAFSHFSMDSRLGLCNVSLFTILSNSSKYKLFFQQFVELGDYVDQIKRYQSHFDSKQIKILFYDDLKSDATDLVSSVFDFLELENIKVDLEIKNQMLSPSNSLVGYLYKSHFARKAMKFIVSDKLVTSIKKYVFRSKNKAKINGEELEFLQQYYSAGIANLEKLTHKDLASWKRK
jgi:hypothetical protein